MAGATSPRQRKQVAKRTQTTHLGIVCAKDLMTMALWVLLSSTFAEVRLLQQV